LQNEYNFRKDLQQADALFEALGQKRPSELKLAWQEASERGPTWRALLNQGLAAASGVGRDWMLKTIDRRRSAIADIDLTFNNPSPHYDVSRDVVKFVGQTLGSPVNCEISREALDDHFGTDGLNQKGAGRSFPQGPIARRAHGARKISLMADRRARHSPDQDHGPAEIY
jgi:hypothetical protein